MEASNPRGNFGTSPTPLQLEGKRFLELVVLLIGATIWRKPNKGLPSNIGARGIGVIFGSNWRLHSKGGLHKAPQGLEGDNLGHPPFLIANVAP